AFTRLTGDGPSKTTHSHTRTRTRTHTHTHSLLLLRVTVFTPLHFSIYCSSVFSSPLSSVLMTSVTAGISTLVYVAGSAPTYLNALVRANVTPRTLRSSSERRLALPSVQARQSKLFSFVVPRWWNELPSTTRAGGVPLYLQEAFEDPTLQRAPPFLTGTLTSHIVRAHV